MTTEVDDRKLRSLSFKIWSYKQGEMVALMIHLGDRLGIYKAMSGEGLVLNNSQKKPAIKNDGY